MITYLIKDHECGLDSYDKFETLGSHSLQKGSEACLCSGDTISPYIMAILLRSRWKIIGSKDGCFKLETSGNE